MLAKIKKISIVSFKMPILLCFMILIGCAIKPELSPVSIFQIDIGKDGKIYFELTDTHTKVVIKNRSNLPGIHHDIDENNYLPEAFVPYLKNNIIRNISKSPGIDILSSIDGAELHVDFNLQYFDVYRETSGAAAAANILLGGLLGAALTRETCTAQISGQVSITDLSTGNVLCTFYPEVKESVEYSMNDRKTGYRNATQNAATELVKQIITGLSNC